MVPQQNLKLKIQLATDQAHQKTEQEIHSLSVEYRDACREVSNRAMKCINFLRRGFRSEAVRLANLEPGIFHQVAALDFPMRSKWVSYARSVGVETPDLPLDMADELQDAMDEDNKAKNILRHYRKLNVFRKSEQGRELVLGQLQEREKNNRVWQENLKRLKQ